ncbi:MAG: YhdH/YhfP family quinone oxidoreductase [Pseudomonadota bacterium]
MENKTFKALVVQETKEKKYVRRIMEKSIDDLPPGDVLVNVKYSSLNYKDALSAIGNKGVTKNYPHTPGIDAAGVVVESHSPDFKPEDNVIVTSYDLGMNTPGGFAEYIRVPADWVVKLPENLSLKESMIYGTAGFTAALSVYRLVEYGVAPDQGEILVTGATGGVGSMALAILAQSGYAVIAVSDKVEKSEFLSGLGAKEIISRNDALDTGGKPLLPGRWAGVIDTVGGDMLATAIKSTQSGGAVTCCGNVASADLPLTVYPFILRGVALFGIDSQNCPMKIRQQIWRKIAGAWKLDHLSLLASEISLDELDRTIDQILQGKLTGRTVVRLV